MPPLLVQPPRRIFQHPLSSNHLHCGCYTLVPLGCHTEIWSSAWLLHWIAELESSPRSRMISNWDLQPKKIWDLWGGNHFHLLFPWEIDSAPTLTPYLFLIPTVIGALLIVIPNRCTSQPNSDASLLISGLSSRIHHRPPILDGHPDIMDTILPRRPPHGDVTKIPTPPLQAVGLFINFVFPALALIFVCLRAYCRIKIKQWGAGECLSRILQWNTS